MAKHLTNTQRINKLVKELDAVNPMMTAILSERIQAIAAMTSNSLKTEPEKWQNGFISPKLYEIFVSKVEEFLGKD